MNLRSQIVHSIIVTTVVAIACAVLPRAQDPLSAAKDLYASAAYEDALSTLSRIEGDAAPPEVSRQIEEYRAFCLYALGRTREAESVAEAMIRKQPLARLDAADASPRLESMFSDVRKRLLPSLIREQFRAARAAIDQKSFSAAEPQLAEAKAMILEAGKLGVKDDGLGDLTVLVDGFLELIQTTAERRPAPQAEAIVASNTAAAPAPPRTTALAPPSAPARQQAAASQTLVPASRPAAAAESATAYTIDDEGVTPPITIQQRMPPMPPQLQAIARAVHARGLVDLVIDETGRVVDARIRQSLNASFDPLVLRSARDWKYRPAVKDGVPVRFVKTILLVP